MTDFQDINNLNPTPTALITGADKVPFYNTSDANPYAMTLDQLQTWVLAGGTIDPTFDDVSADTVTITGTTGNTLVVDTNTLVVDATNNAVLVGKTAASVGVDGAQFLTTGFSGVSAPNNTVFFLNRNGSDGTIVELARESTSRVTFGVTSQSLTIGTGGSERMRLDSSGNLGIGNTPSAWATANGQKALQVTVLTALWTGANGGATFGFNAFESGVNAYTYATTNPASFYQQAAGQHRWSSAPSGTAGNAITFTETMRLDASGNLGIGVTPSAWSVLTSVLQVKQASLVSESSDQVYLTANAFFDGSWKYINSDIATQYYQSSGTHVWRTAPSGTAGNAITFTTAMTLDASSNLTVGGWVRASAASAGAASTTTIGSTTATTVGAAGGASALPATPLGYIIAHVGTTQVKIPYYNN